MDAFSKHIGMLWPELRLTSSYPDPDSTQRYYGPTVLPPECDRVSYNTRAARRVKNPDRNRSGFTGNRSNRFGPVSVPASHKPAQIQI